MYKKKINIKRENALKNVEGLLERIKEINKDNKNPFFVTYAALFGSILTEKDKLGDIDVDYHKKK